MKYRYSRLGDSKIPEVQPNGDPVRYRLCYVTHEIHIIDHLNGWLGKSLRNDAGRLSGTIIDKLTQAPVPDILVSAGGQLTFTDANGQFVLGGLPSGIHNLVAYAMNGSYQTFQQGAEISSRLTTPANIELQSMPGVQVQLNVIPPDEIQGAPIYLAGNIIQLGNAFHDLTGSMSVYPKKMPSLSQNEDGSYSIELTLFAGTDLRYKFTLGDGFWNAERAQNGELRTRQIIIPNQDLSINHQIASWRSSNTEPVTFDIKIPSETYLQDEMFIQFNAGNWTEPIPLWPTGGNNYLYILFSPLDEISPLGYRFCRNSDCQNARSDKTNQGQVQIQPGEPAQTVTVTIDRWENWQVSSDSPAETFTGIPLPADPANYSTMIELTPEIDHSWAVYAPIGLSTIAESGASVVIFAPRWQTQVATSLLQPVLGVTPRYSQLTTLLQSAKNTNLQRGLFPQVDYEEPMEEWRSSFNPSDENYEHWQDSYQRFILSYANIAEFTQSEWLILDGETPLHTFENGALMGDLPEERDDFWLNLISEIRSIYQGKILWATHAHTTVDPQPAFIDELDGIYIMIDSPLASANSTTSQEIAAEFSRLIDNHIYEIYRSTMKPVYLAFAYPSVEGASQGCLLVNPDCANDGLFLPDETELFSVDQDAQYQIYSAILPVVASREWITGTSIRGYEPSVNIQDGSSSIAGKSANQLIRDWFLRIKTP